MAVFQRILKNLLAMFTSRIITVLQQLLIPPIFIARYSIAQYGEWGVLSGAVVALGMLNFGVQTFVNQDLAVRLNRGDIEDYRLCQSTALRLLCGVVFAASILCLTVFLVPLNIWLHLDLSRHDTQWTVYLLCLGILVNILYGYLGGLFMAVGLAHRGGQWNNFQSVLSIIGLLICVSFHMSFPILASVQLFSILCAILGVLIDLHHTAPQVFPNIDSWDRSAVMKILKPSSHFGLLTVCTFLTFQAPLIVLQRFAGPVVVAAFIIMRIVFSMCRQILAMFTQSMGPEITVLFGRSDWPGISRLYEYSERFIFFLIPVLNTGVLLISPVLITVWMHKKAELFSPYPYVLTAAVSMVMSLKEHKVQFQYSTNTHMELARLMFLSYAAMIAVSIGTVHWFGIVGFLYTWLCTEIFQMASIVRLNMKLFAHFERLEIGYLRRLVATCIPALFISYLLLEHTATRPMLWQIGVAVAGGFIVAASGWFLFGVSDVLKRISSLLSRKFA